MKKSNIFEKMKIPQTFSKKSVLITTLCVIIALSLVTTLILIINKSQNDEYVTRGEWITMLGETFGLTTYEQEEPYFLDIPDDHEIFDYVQASYEWNVLREAKHFKPNKLATRSFVAQTAVLAAMPIYDSSFADMDNDELFGFAVDKKIVFSDVAKGHLTEEECAEIIENAKKYYLSLVPEEYANIELKENVIDYSSSEDIQVDEDTVYFPENTGKELEVGTIFIAPGYPYGVAKKVSSVNQIDGQIVVTTEEPELDEIVEELNFCFIGAPSYEDIIPMQDGVTICTLDELEPTNDMKTQPYFTNLGSTVSLKKDISTKNKPISFGTKINITNGKLTLNEGALSITPAAYKDIFGQEIPDKAGDILEKSNKRMVYDKNGNPKFEQVEKWKAGYEITGELKVKDFYIEFSYEDKFKSFSSQLHFTVESSLKVKGKLEGSVPIYKMTIPGPYGVGIDVVFSVYVDFNGELKVGVELDNNISVTFQNNKFKSAQDVDCESSIGLSGGITSGVKGEVIPTFLGLKLVDLSVKVGFGVEGEVVLHQSAEKTMLCCGAKLYAPIVSVSIGENKETLWKKFPNIKVTLKLVDKSGALIKAKQQTLCHYEFTGAGFANVKKCTWGKFSSQPETKAKHESNETQHSAKTEAETTQSTPNQSESETTTVTTGKTEPETTQSVDVDALPEGQGLEFTLNIDGKSYSVTGIGTCTDSNIVIPQTYNGLLVTNIGEYAFRGCTSLSSIYIPESVTSIGSHAFAGCSNLMNISIPEGVTVIDENTFINCSSLEIVTLPNSVTSIGMQAFFQCFNLKSINLPEGVTSIGENAFLRCTSLTSIIIPDSVTSIGIWAFGECISLSSIVVPGSVTSIGELAFGECTSLTSVTFLDGVTSVGENMFYECTNLTSVNIPDSVISIGECAFLRCTSLASIIIPDNVMSIGDGAFAGCTSLTSIDIPNSVTSIGGSAFGGCDSLTSVTIPNRVTSIGDHAFSNCTSLTSITIPDSVTNIYKYAFYGCTSLKDVYYTGTMEEWQAITIASRNDGLINATIHYNS